MTTSKAVLNIILAAYDFTESTSLAFYDYEEAMEAYHESLEANGLTSEDVSLEDHFGFIPEANDIVIYALSNNGESIFIKSSEDLARFTQNCKEALEHIHDECFDITCTDGAASIYSTKTGNRVGYSCKAV